jgi:hypothetical protein
MLRRSTFILVRLLLLTVTGALVVILARYLPNELHVYKRVSPENRVATPTPTVEPSNEILGIGIGSTLEEAHQKLDPLRDPSSAIFRDKEANEGDGGEKAYWRLVGTEYSWIMVWANKERRLVQISASVRPEKLKPFAEVGDLSKATVSLESVAKWNVLRPNNRSYQLVAKGPNRHANNIYMIATTLER